ncbi:hypothetical protein JCM8547_002955 [Rhodosporidiobolus lusitaniae]
MSQATDLLGLHSVLDLFLSLEYLELEEFDFSPDICSLRSKNTKYKTPRSLRDFGENGYDGSPSSSQWRPRPSEPPQPHPYFASSRAPPANASLPPFAEPPSTSFSPSQPAAASTSSNPPLPRPTYPLEIDGPEPPLVRLEPDRSLKPFLPGDLIDQKRPRVKLDSNWPGFRIESMYLGSLDERGFEHFAVERDVKIHIGNEGGLLELTGQAKRGVAIRKFAFNDAPAIKIVFPSGSIGQLYIAPASSGSVREADEDEEDSEVDRYHLCIETRWTPYFYAQVVNSSKGQPSYPDASVRMSALDKPHARQVPFLSRHFLLTLLLPRDRSPRSFHAFETAISFSPHLPSLVSLPSLSLLDCPERYSEKAKKDLSKALGSLLPNISFHLEGILRDGTLYPDEIRTLIAKHVEPSLYTSSYGDILTEDILIELRIRLEEERKVRAQAVKVAAATPRQLREARMYVRSLEKFAELARQTEHCRHTYLHTIKVGGKLLEKSNALIRRYYHNVDGVGSESVFFLRVQFLEENGLPLPPDARAEWTRLIDASIRSVMKKGLMFGGRQYEFLAYSQSALRNRSVYFVAPWPVWQNNEKRMIVAADIRVDLGMLDKILRKPALLGARYSLAFTSSSVTEHVLVDQIKIIPDFNVLDEDSKEVTNHTDGSGLMSVELRDKIWRHLVSNGFRRDHEGSPPTVFQIRIGGFKGVLALDKTLDGVQLLLRPSMDKHIAFADDRINETYCVNLAEAVTRPNAVRLNRLLISALDDLGISTTALLKYQSRAVEELSSEALDTVYGTLNVLKRYQPGRATRFSSLLGSILNMNEKLDIKLEEPFLRTSSKALRTRALRDIKNGARIPLPASWKLMGVPDEGEFLLLSCGLLYLDESQIYACIRLPDHEQPIYLTGRIVITRSPVNDPGDVRVVQAIGQLPPEDARWLKMAALENAVVLPTVGQRSLASQMGAGDVDGDQFDVITPLDIIPALEALVEPRSRAAKPPLELDREATIGDLADCFVNYCQHDTVGTIATQHLIAADQEPEHGRSKLCQTLADLHSSGVPPFPPSSPQPPQQPTFVRSLQGLPTPPSSPPRPLNPQFAPSSVPQAGPHPRYPTETRPTAHSFSQSPSTGPPARLDVSSTVSPPFSPPLPVSRTTPYADPWAIRDQQLKAYGQSAWAFYEPHSDDVPDGSDIEDDEDQRKLGKNYRRMLTATLPKNTAWKEEVIEEDDELGGGRSYIAHKPPDLRSPPPFHYPPPASYTIPPFSPTFAPSFSSLPPLVALSSPSFVRPLSQSPELAHPRPSRRDPSFDSSILSSEKSWGETAGQGVVEPFSKHQGQHDAEHRWYDIYSPSIAPSSPVQQCQQAGPSRWTSNLPLPSHSSPPYQTEAGSSGWRARRSPPPHPPAPPTKKQYYSKNPPFWQNFTDVDKRRYKSNQTELGKLGHLVTTADGVPFRQAVGLGTARYGPSSSLAGQLPPPGTVTGVGEGGWGQPTDVPSWGGSGTEKKEGGLWGELPPPHKTQKGSGMRKSKGW